MKNIFFQFPEGTPKVALTVSDKSVEELKEIGVIPKSSKTVIKPFNKNPKAKELGMSIHVDKLKFNNNFTDVEFDLELLALWFLDFYREIRVNVFKVLDMYQSRALAEGRQDLLEVINSDKQALRDLTTALDLQSCTTPEQIANKVPFELAIDYDEKYKDLF
jgi:hypothetical protein